MTAEINFYQVDETISKSLAPLLLKVLEEKKKALIFCVNENKMKEIDDSLWSYGRNKFIPHATVFDREFPLKRQPILISNKEENSNAADYLIFFDAPSGAFISGFARAFYFFEGKDANLAEELNKKLQPKNFYKKVDGKWARCGG